MVLLFLGFKNGLIFNLCSQEKTTSFQNTFRGQFITIWQLVSLKTSKSFVTQKQMVLYSSFPVSLYEILSVFRSNCFKKAKFDNFSFLKKSKVASISGSVAEKHNENCFDIYHQMIAERLESHCYVNKK